MMTQVSVERSGESSMAEQHADKLRINARAFLDDFVRGISEEEILSKYSLTIAQYRRVVGLLQQRGELTTEHAAERDENPKIRYGNAPSPSVAREPKRVAGH